MTATQHRYATAAVYWTCWVLGFAFSLCMMLGILYLGLVVCIMLAPILAIFAVIAAAVYGVCRLRRWNARR